MKFARLLVCLFAALALAMPPLAVKAATPQAVHAEMDCPHAASDQKGETPADGKQTRTEEAAQSCCPSAPFGWAVVDLDAANPHSVIVDRAPRTSRSLDGLTFSKDPPPPRA